MLRLLIIALLVAVFPRLILADDQGYQPVEFSTLLEHAKGAFGDSCYKIDVSEFDSGKKLNSKKVIYFDGQKRRIRLEGSIYSKKTETYRPFKYEFSFDDVPNGNLWQAGEKPITRWALRLLAEDFFETNNSLGVLIGKRKAILAGLDQSSEEGKQLAGIFARSIADLTPIDIGDYKIVAGGDNMSLVSAKIDQKGFISELVKRGEGGITAEISCGPARWPNDTLPLGAMIYLDDGADKSASPKPFGVVLKKVDGKVMVTDVLPDSEAAKCGVQSGWYFSRIGSRQIDDSMSFAEIVTIVREFSQEPIYFESEGKEIVVKREVR